MEFHSLNVKCHIKTASGITSLNFKVIIKLFKSKGKNFSMSSVVPKYIAFYLNFNLAFFDISINYFDSEIH